MTARSRTRVAVMLLASATPLSCADVIVGQYSGGTEAETTSAEASTAADTEPGGGFVPPGCYADDFDAADVDSSLWNAWTEADSSIAVTGGWLRFTPPSYGLFDAGLVGHFDYRFDFERDGWVRMRIAQAPAVERSVVLFLLVASEPETLAISLSGGTVSVSTAVDEIPTLTESFPRQPYPQWLGIRSEGSVAHFEVSDDGQSWTTLTTLDKPGSFAESAAMIMAQTFGDDAQAEVAVDRLEVCVQ